MSPMALEVQRLLPIHVTSSSFRFVMLHWIVIFRSWWTPLLWTLTMLRMRAIELCTHNVYSASHYDPAILDTHLNWRCGTLLSIILSLCIQRSYLPSKYDAFTQCCFNVGPPSSTLAQNWMKVPCVWVYPCICYSGMTCRYAITL